MEVETHYSSKIKSKHYYSLKQINKAAGSNNVDAIELLILSGANINAKDNNGIDALMTCEMRKKNFREMLNEINR